MNVRGRAECTSTKLKFYQGITAENLHDVPDIMRSLNAKAASGLRFHNTLTVWNLSALCVVSLTSSPFREELEIQLSWLWRIVAKTKY